jgi:hypothetical protein
MLTCPASRMSDAPGGLRSKGSKQGFTTENIEDHGAVSILGASCRRLIEDRAKRRYSLLRGPRMFSVLKTCLPCRSTRPRRKGRSRLSGRRSSIGWTRRVTLVGLDPRISISVLCVELSRIPGATDARARPENDGEKTIPTPSEG